MNRIFASALLAMALAGCLNEPEKAAVKGPTPIPDGPSGIYGVSADGKRKEAGVIKEVAPAEALQLDKGLARQKQMLTRMAKRPAAASAPGYPARPADCMIDFNRVNQYPAKPSSWGPLPGVINGNTPSSAYWHYCDDGTFASVNAYNFEDEFELDKYFILDPEYGDFCYSGPPNYYYGIQYPGGSCQAIFSGVGIPRYFSPENPTDRIWLSLAWQTIGFKSIIVGYYGTSTGGSPGWEPRREVSDGVILNFKFYGAGWYALELGGGYNWYFPDWFTGMRVEAVVFSGHGDVGNNGNTINYCRNYPWSPCYTLDNIVFVPQPF